MDPVPDNSTNDEAMPLEKTPKPPPIFVPLVANISLMLKALRKVISNHEFSYKTLPDGTVKLKTTTVEVYRTTVKYLKDKNVQFHTYQIK